MTLATGYRDPVRNVDQAFLAGLELTSTKVYPLPGATGRRQANEIDARLSKLAGTTPVGDVVTYYEHIATVRHQATGQFFIAFRETMDAFLARQTDPSRYPEWLMKSPEKQSERSIHIYLVTRHPKTVGVLRSHEDWLAHITDTRVFDVVAHFLAKHNVIDQKVLSTIR